MPDIREHSLELLRLITAAFPIDEDAVLAWDENDQCALSFDDDQGVIFTFDDVVGAIFINWVVGELPENPEDQAEAMRELLEANHEWRMTEGGALGVDPDTGYVTLCYRVDLTLDNPAVIQDVVVKLFNVTQHWQKTLKKGFSDDEPGEAESPRSVRDAL